MLFSLQVKGYQGIMNAIKLAATMVPFPKPTLFSGPGSSLEMSEAIAQMGHKKLFIVTDAMLVKIGVINGILNTLKKNHVDVVIYDKVLPDPTYNQVEDGLELLKASDCDGILAIGGGSPIDAAKVIAARMTNDKPIAKLAGMFKVWKTPFPLFAVPTTAGTGSEVTVAAVVSEPKTHKKTPIIDPKLVPVMAALDASLMTGLPAPITAATGMDALTHAIEAYLSVNASPDTDGYAIAATKLIMENLTTAVKQGDNIKARHNMAMASYYAGLAFTKASVGYVHAISHNLGAMYHTPHGIGNAIVLPLVLDYYYKEGAIERMAQLAEAADLKKGRESDATLAKKLISHIRAMMKDFDIPETLIDLKKEDVTTLAKAALKEAHYNYPVPRYMDQKECEELLRKMVA